ncbi:iron complex outermembrane recepter protein [Marivirga sericea]|uniref:Iron complex outermembrane recepter protein n=1 Tax=Marivirga sericea TaxID=1028 RepID=A0A1X7IZA4_9BACT|nr:TonB-dependent receptor [Marivirga sericea]SMG20515.1 iron complex outermembrane recepter protein [Marivirga sericea]
MMIAQFGLAQEKCSALFSGQVLSEVEHQPIAFASIYLPALGDGVQTDENGYFSIKISCHDKYEVVISQVEFQSITTYISVDIQNLKKDFYLEQKNNILSAVSVHSHKREEVLLSNVESVLSTRELRKLKGKSLSESVSTLPGVYNIKTGPGINKPMIHGLYGSRIQVVNNEVSQMGQQWGVDHAPEIDPFVASRITIVKGASSVKYGPRAIGGALLLEPEPLLPDSLIHGSLDLVGFTNGRGGIGSAMISGSFLLNDEKSINWRLQSSAKKSGDLQAANYNLTNTGSEELNFSAAANYIKQDLQADLFYSRFSTEIGILRGAHIGNVDNFFEALDQRPPFFTEDFSYEINNPKQNVVHQLLKAKVHLDRSDYGDFDFIYAYQQNTRQEFDVRRGGRSNKPSVDLQLDSHVAKLLFHHEPVWGNLSGEIGLDYEYQNNKNVPGTGTTPLIPNYSSFQIGTFINEAWAEENWSLEAGLRFDAIGIDVLKFNEDDELINPQHQYNMFSGIVGGGYDFSANLKYKSNLSWSQRAPSINELYSQGLHHSVAAIEEGDDQLSPETSFKWLHSVQYNHKEKLRVKVDAYASRIQNYIYLEPEEPRLTIRGAFPVYQYRQTLADIFGMDIMGSYEFFHHLTFNTKASIIRGNDISNELPLIFMPADRWENSLNWRISNVLGFKEIDFALSGLQVFEQFRAPITETEAYERATVPVPEGYFITNFSLDTTRKLENAQLNVGLSIYNLMNTDYTDYLNRLRFYAAETGRNFELRINYIF